MAYYAENRRSVERLLRFDPLDLQHRLPRRLLQLPYDLLNRLNRRRLLHANTELTTSIRMEDYRIAPVSEECFDLSYTVRWWSRRGLRKVAAELLKRLPPDKCGIAAASFSRVAASRFPRAGVPGSALWHPVFRAPALRFPHFGVPSAALGVRLSGAALRK